MNLLFALHRISHNTIEECVDLARQNGHHPIVAENGEDALRIIENTHLDYLILSWCMPYVRGIEILEELRKRDFKLPVIILSLLSEKELRRIVHEEAGYKHIKGNYEYAFCRDAVLQAINELERVQV